MNGATVENKKHTKRFYTNTNKDVIFNKLHSSSKIHFVFTTVTEHREKHK